MTQRFSYRGYDILPEAMNAGWIAWILYREVPYGRVSDQPSATAAVATAKQEIDQWEAQRQRDQGRPNGFAATRHIPRPDR